MQNICRSHYVITMKPSIRKILWLAPCIFFQIAPAQADWTMDMRPPKVTKFVVTCEYVDGVVSPLQIHIAETYPWERGYKIEFINMQTGLSQTVVPKRIALISGVGIFPIPSLQSGIYDVKVAWRKGFPEPLEKPDKGIFLFEGLKIPDIKSTGGRGTGCRF